MSLEGSFIWFIAKLVPLGPNENPVWKGERFEWDT